ncbi:family 78 glycoside hydrolase catalytic domain [Labilibaculum manganireducens]|nr:family 78 glycoside hydrolase catalytic domain [Labilibaculum manganireducens]
MREFMVVCLIVIHCLNCQAQNNDTEEKNMFQASMIKPDRIAKLSDEHYFFDFGKDAFGTLIIEIKSPQTDTLIVHLGEKLAEDGTIDRKPGGTIRYQKVMVTDIPVNEKFVLSLQRDRRNTKSQAIALPDSFGVIMPFRYCEIEKLNVPISDVAIRQKRYNYRFNDSASSFVSSDTILNQVWDLCKYTIKATSFAGIYVDGDRERIPYEADAYINQLSHYCVDHEYGMAKETIKHFVDYPTWPTEWLLHTILMVYQDYYYTGDTSLISCHYEQLKEKTLYQLADKDGLISSYSDKVTGEFMHKIGFTDTTQRLIDIVDWPPAQKDSGWELANEAGERDGHEMLPVNTVVNCFFYENMCIMAELAGVLNKEDDAKFFSRMAEKSKYSINEKLFNKEKGIYIDGIGSTHGSIHSNMLPLAFGLVPEKYKHSVVAFVKTRKMACSVYGAQYLLEGLYRAGEASYALDLMTSTSDRSWWNMIRVGSTMAMEAWDMKYKSNSDWNHAWGTAPGNIVTRYMWGITPAEPGFEKVQVSPQMSNLSFSTIKVPTIKGPINAEFKQKNGRTKLFILELPQGMEGEFSLIAKGEKSKVMVNKIAVRSKDGQIPLKPGFNRISIKEKKK